MKARIRPRQNTHPSWKTSRQARGKGGRFQDPPSEPPRQGSMPSCSWPRIQLQATQNEWRAKLSEAKSKAAAAEALLRSQLAAKESSMADVIAGPRSEAQLRAQLLDVKQQASSETV